MSARALGFAGLLFASPAFAQEPAQVIAEAAAAPAAHAQLTPRWTVEVKGDRVLVSLHVRNTDDAAIDVMVNRGSLPGATASARVLGDVYLEPVLSREDRNATMSRWGPTPRYAVAGVGEEVQVGAWALRRDASLAAEPITLSASVWAGEDRVVFEWTGSGDGTPVVESSS